MYCVAAYPARTANLAVIDRLKKVCPYVGYSDHTLDVTYLPYAANALHGAVAIEKHFTIVNRDTPDAGHSLDELQFATMVDYIRGRKKAQILPAPEERDMLLRHKRRLIATKDIKEGEKLALGKNFGLYRSLSPDVTGFPPHMAEEVEGVRVKRAILAGEAISVGHVE
jgi:sialic acid synthase SpsE